MEFSFPLSTHFDPVTGAIEGYPLTVRRLSDLQGSFADEQAFRGALALGDPVVYTVSGFEAPAEEGQLNYALGKIMPGKIGQEYYLTKGHFHAWRPAAEVYIGLAGEGFMLLESEDGSQSQMLPLRPNQAVYVPGYIAHRTVNTGSVPLTYVGVYPAQAGHDYGAIARQNFRHVILEVDGQPKMVERSELLR
jgi:glucose-6-phosphate isomerase, archaeal